jgi:hypothetical protein
VKYKVGDRVRYWHDLLKDPILGFTGTISYIKDDGDSILVYFDEENEIFHNGLEKDPSIRRYYWLPYYFIEPVVADTKLNRILYPDLTPDGKGNLL